MPTDADDVVTNKDLKNFMDSAEEGVIYMSLGGTNVQSANIPESLKAVILETFAELPYKVLWKYEADNLAGKPENVKLAKWLPQQDILRHPNLKLFITQGGIQSLEESVFSYIPMVGMPFFGDQHNNIRRMTNRGLGLEVDRNTVDKETFKRVILEVIKNPKYKETVKKIADLSSDQPMSGLEKAVWWTEYVLRHKGAQHLKGPATKIPAYQYYLLDVLSALAAALCLVIFIIYKIIIIISRLVKSLFSTKRRSKIN